MTMQGLKHSGETIEKMRVKAKVRGNNKVDQKLKGKPRSFEVLEKMRPTMFQKGFKPWNKGIHHLQVQREKHPNWKGGITPETRSIRVSLEYKLWRTAVFERDKYTCMWCGRKSMKGQKAVLHADHIQEFAKFPELRFAIDNGRTLCKQCHSKRHRRRF